MIKQPESIARADGTTRQSQRVQIRTFGRSLVPGLSA